MLEAAAAPPVDRAMTSPEIFVPDGLPESSALPRTTRLGIGAHQDDLEFMAFHGIAECFYCPDEWFGGVICTNGAGSSRTGPYAGTTDEEMQAIRRAEQRQAAGIGRYSFISQLNYPSSAIARPLESPLVKDLLDLLEKSTPEIVYTHNPADKHPTHLRVLVATLEAIRLLPSESRPRQLFGCEMWRSLDWLDDSHKIVQNLSGHEHLAAALSGVFDSQIAGGKRYDLAVKGRRRANATLLQSHAGDHMSAAAFAMDLTPLIGKSAASLVDFTSAYIEIFRESVQTQLKETLNRP